ncbi:hypothetical protein MNBD_GAMMA03-323 [hydrothermal vent metagenome]|uniref:DUF11 domain-containing protein n=1 Tax=hydrothermal vent metagenome TaxID=652676 RepID=A0A3B0WA54_9ZZZZ
MAFVNQIQLLFLVVFSLGFTFVQAKETHTLNVTMTAMEEITVLNDQGEVSIQQIEPTNIVPGDTVVYRTDYRNNYQQTINRVAITNPIPKHLIYIQGSAEQDDVPVMYSINNGKTFAAADKLLVTDEKGATRPATMVDYTHIRWVISSVLPKEKGTLSFRAKVK